MRFDFTDLAVFLDALEGGSLTRAAAENNIVVAAVSTRLRRLEDAFKITLFERTSRGVTPTIAGERFARHARMILQQARDLEQDLDQFADGNRGRVRLLSNTNMLAEHLPQALGSFLSENPEIAVDVRECPSHEVVRLIASGETDIGIVASSADMQGLERTRFVPDRLVVVVARDADLPSQPTGFSRILDFKLITTEDFTALQQFLHRIADQMGRRLDVRIQLPGFESICRMVERGAGVAVMPDSAAQRYAKTMNVRIVPLADTWADRELYLCVRSEEQLPAYARKLLHHLRAYALQHVSA